MQTSDLRPAYELAKKMGVKSIVYGPPGVGKCLGLDTPIRMYSGDIKLVQDVVVGDMLMGPDSQPRRVESLARGRETMHRIVPHSGSKDAFTCNSSHLLSLAISGEEVGNGIVTGGKGVRKISTTDPRIRKRNAQGQYVEHAGYMIDRSYAEISSIVLTVADYANLPKTKKDALKCWSVGYTFATQSCPIDPYFLGVWLGDGSSDRLEITKHPRDAEILWEIDNYAKTCGLSVRRSKLSKGTSTDDSSQSWMLFDTESGSGSGRLGNLFREHNLFDNKHVPDFILKNSRDVRLQLLAGILDTDGHMSKNAFEIVQKNKRLSDDVVTLSRSLGFAVSTKECQKSATNGKAGNIGTYYRSTINGNVWEIPLRLSRKRVAPYARQKDARLSGFTVEDLGEGDYYGFELSGPDKLFLLGDCTVTHNTPLAANTTPRPVLLITEPGTMTLRNCNTPAYEAYTVARIEEFFAWLHSSADAANFDTVIVDSISQMAETYIIEGMANGSKTGGQAHGLKVYGQMSETIMKHMMKLYFMPNKHCVLIAKEHKNEENGLVFYRPYYPGKDLHTKMPHLFDLVMQLGKFSIPGHGEHLSFKCNSTFDAQARDRSGALAQYEGPDLGAIFNKCMGASA